MERDDLNAWLRLTLTHGIGNAAMRRLLQAFGLPQSVFQQSGAALGQCVSSGAARTRARQQRHAADVGRLGN